MHPSAREGGREREATVLYLGSPGLGEGEEEERRMSYSCTSRGNSQEPSSAKKPAGDNPGRDTGGTDSSSTGSPKQTAAMKVKKGCNSTDVGVPVTTEEDLLASAVITPEDVLGLQKITESKFTAAAAAAASSASVRTEVLENVPAPL